MLKEIVAIIQEQRHIAETGGDGFELRLAAAIHTYYTNLFLEMIGEDDEMATKEFGLDPDEVFMPADIIYQIRNQLRAELRTKIREMK